MARKRKEFDQLSERQKNILYFIYDYVKQNNYPPTIRDIGEATKIKSTSVVNYNLNKLVDAQYIEREEHVSRGLRIVAPIPGRTDDRRSVRNSKQGKKIPLIGHIVASKPVEMPEETGQHWDEDDMIDVPASLLGGFDPEETYALKVRGESMIDAMINEGDIVILRRQETAINGDMVAVWLTERNETTLKYFHREGDKVRLQPAHPTMDPIYVNARECEIRGKVLSVIRHVH